MSSRRTLLQLASLALATSLAWPARALRSSGPLRLICTAPPGGTPDLVARAYAARLVAHGAAEVHVDNRPGGGGLLAIAALRQSPPDGRTMLLLHGAALTMYPFLYATLAYDPVRDLVPVSLAARLDFGVAVGPAVPAQVRDLAGLLAWARLSSSPVTYGSPGMGTLPHVIGARLFGEADLPGQHVPYGGGPQAILDLAAGRLCMVILPEGLLRPQRSTSVRILATLGAARSATLPDVPTGAEQGFESLNAQEWLGWFVARHTPDAAVREHAAALVTAAGELAATFSELGIIAAASSPGDLARRITAEQARWAEIIPRTGIRLE